MQFYPSSTIGIIGGGQLGRMLAMAAAHMGYKTHIYCPDEDSPASEVATYTTIAPYEDMVALKRFGEQVDVVTFEFENVPFESLEMLEQLVTVRPKPSVLATCRHRLREKDMVNAQGIATAPYAAVRSADELASAVAQIGVPSVLKTCELGYDGKGQIKIESAEGLADVWAELNTSEAVLEGWISFEREISVIVARDIKGNSLCYDPVHNIHENHILARTIAPAGLSDAVTNKAKAIGMKLAESMELIGIMAVEMFLKADGELIVNELAPRPHNSGHWTMEASATSQFEQQVRAICGHALGDTAVICLAEMINLIGDDVHEWQRYAEDANAHLHLYGKSEVRDGRKMGHVTILKPNG